MLSDDRLKLIEIIEQGLGMADAAGEHIAAALLAQALSVLRHFLLVVPPGLIAVSDVARMAHPDLRSARREAVRLIRAVLGREQAPLDLDRAIAITDAAGDMVMNVPFAAGLE